MSEQDTVSPRLDPPPFGLGAWRRFGRRLCSALLRTLHGCGRFSLALASIVAIFVGLFSWALARGPIALDWLSPLVVESLDTLYGGRVKFGLGAVALANTEHGPTLTAEGLTVKLRGKTIVAAPRAELSVDLSQLFAGKVQPRRLQVLDLQLRLALKANGEVSISAGADPSDALVFGPPAVAASPQAGDAPAPHAVRARILELAGAAARALIDLATNPNSVIGGVDHVGVVHGSLVIDDGAAQRVIHYGDLTLTLDRDRNGSKFTLAATGAVKRWSLVATASGAPGAKRSFGAEARDFTLDEVALLAATRNLHFDSDAPLAAHIHLALDPDDLVAEATGGVNVGAGFFRLDEPDHEPVMIEHAEAEARWDRKSRQFVFPTVRFKTQGAEAAFEAALTPPASSTGGAPPVETTPADVWTGSLRLAKTATFMPERTGEEPLKIDALDLRFHVSPAEKHFEIERFEGRGPTLDASGTTRFDWANGPHVVFDAKLENTELPTVIRLLPTHFGSAVRAWLLEHVPTATIKHGEYHSDFDEADLVAMRYDHPPSEASIRGEGEVVNGVMTELLPDFPPLKNVAGHLRMNGRSFSVDHASGSVETAHEKRVALTEGGFNIPNETVQPAPATLDIRFSGGVDAITEIMALPALAPYASMPIDAAQLKGQIDGRAHVDLEVGDGARSDHVNVSLNADASNFSVERFLGAEKLENGSLNIVHDHSGLKVTGLGRLLGGAASLDIRRGPGDKAPVQALLSVALDEAARAKLGYGSPGVSGPVVVNVKTPLPLPEAETQIELDLTKTSLENAIPGLAKPAGKTGKAAFVLAKRGDSLTLDRFLLEAGATQMQGVVELTKEGVFRSAKFSQFRLSPGDDAKLDVSRGSEALKLTVRGANIDARPFLKALGSASVEPRGGPTVSKSAVSFSDVDVDLKSTIVSGFNKEILSNVDLKWERRGNRPRRFALTGHFGREPLVAAMERNENGAPQVEISCADAGSLFAFLDLYSRMDAGALSASVQLTSPGRSDGVLNLRDFYLKNEPAIRQLMTQGAHRADDKGNYRFDPESVRVQRLQAQFAWENGRMILRDGVMSGPEMGLTFDGAIDFGHEGIDLGGTYVPLYGLNNLASNVPIFGPLLTGGAHEGLFGLNYSVTGRIDQASINVSPLSFLAPGLLRKMLGAMDGTARNLNQPLH